MYGIARIFAHPDFRSWLKETSSRPKSKSALLPKADIADGSHQSLLVTHFRRSASVDLPSPST